MEIVGENFMEDPSFQNKEDVIQCCTTRFADGEKIAGFRSPHNSPNNIVYLENVYPELLRKYFPKLGKNVIVINGIGTDVQSRLNGQDLDSDSIYATNQKEIVELAKKAYAEYPTIINRVTEDKITSYKKDMKSYAEMDNKISAAQYAIGEASNLAQLALCYYYESNCDDEELKEVFVICSVLAQVAIDSAKRPYVVNVNHELARIRNFECMKKYKPKYPRFYADIQELKGEKIKDEDIKMYNCPMDILYKIIDKGIIDLRKCKKMNTKTIEVKELLAFDVSKVKERERKQCLRLKELIKNCEENINKLKPEEEDYYEKATAEFEKCADKIKKWKIKEANMCALIRDALNMGKNRIDFGGRMLTVLYEKDPKMFLKCFKKTVDFSTENDKIA